MQTIKTGIVIALLIAVCYGAIVALNAPDPEFPSDIEEWATGEAEIEQLVGFDLSAELASMDSAVPITADQLMNPSSFPTSSQGNIAADLTVEIPSSSLPQLPVVNNAQASVAQLEFPSAGSPPGLSEFPALADPGFSAPSFPSLTVDSSKPVVGQAVATQTNIDLSPNQFESEAAAPSIPPLLDSSEPSGQTAASRSVGQSESPQPALPFSAARTQALEQASRGELLQALQMLSLYFASPELGSAEREDLLEILDALSREVIYSTKHLLEPAHEVRPTDTLASLAQAYHVNPELIALMNKLGDSSALVAGSKLKVVRGPMRASVSLDRGELTLFLGELYAGRFPVSFGGDPAPRAGSFEIVDRQRDRRYYGAGGVVLEANDPRNPYGGYWLNLGNDLYIHGTPEMASSDLDDAGCISLAPLDAKDAFSILGLGSQVVIRN